MRSLSDTLERLARLKKQPFDDRQATRELVPLSGFGSNPGNLSGLLAIPSLMRKRPALVVVLHGCRQTAGSYDLSAGWSKLAEEEGFIVLYPQQERANNPNLCFNWFSREDASRDMGEALSIRQMIAHVVENHDVDHARIFITGLSAGGAMANVMLASYPDVFAGGAIIAGLPFGTAHSIPEAFDRMRGQRLPAQDELQARLRDASSHQGPWPRLSVWHGTNDTTVHEANAQASLAQWRGVHGLADTPDHREESGGHQRHVWTDARGQEVLEFYRLSGMGHGTPLDPRLGYEQEGPFMLDVGVSATLSTARFFGLLEPKEGRTFRPVAASQLPPQAEDNAAPVGSHVRPDTDQPNIQAVIERALRSAGLMR